MEKNRPQKIITPELLSWVIPLIITLLLSGYEIYSLIQRVNILENRSMTIGEQAIKELHELKHKVDMIDSFCCSEIVLYRKFIDKREEHELESNTKH